MFAGREVSVGGETAGARRGEGYEVNLGNRAGGELAWPWPVVEGGVQLLKCVFAKPNFKLPNFLKPAWASHPI